MKNKRRKTCGKNDNGWNSSGRKKICHMKLKIFHAAGDSSGSIAILYT